MERWVEGEGRKERRERAEVVERWRKRTGKGKGIDVGGGRFIIIIMIRRIVVMLVIMAFRECVLCYIFHMFIRSFSIFLS